MTGLEKRGRGRPANHIGTDTAGWRSRREMREHLRTAGLSQEQASQKIFMHKTTLSRKLRFGTFTDHDVVRFGLVVGASRADIARWLGDLPLKREAHPAATANLYERLRRGIIAVVAAMSGATIAATIALQYIADQDPPASPVEMTFGELLRPPPPGPTPFHLHENGSVETVLNSCTAGQQERVLPLRAIEPTGRNGGELAKYYRFTARTTGAPITVSTPQGRLDVSPSADGTTKVAVLVPNTVRTFDLVISQAHLDPNRCSGSTVTFAPKFSGNFHR